MQLKNLLPVAFGAVASAQSLADVISNNSAQLSTLNTLLAAQPAILSALGSASNITILAPSNTAFETFLASPQGMAAGNNSGAVAALLQYHVVSGTYYALDFTSSPLFLPTLLTNETYTNVTGGQRIEAIRNGTNVSIYSGLVQKSSVTTPNLNFTGGTVHIIDHVLNIPQPVGATAVAGNLTTLVSALTTANLVDAVQDLKDITVFAPSNAAFAAIGSAVANLTVAQLAGILEYHVINGTVGYSSTLTNTTLTALDGRPVTIRIENGSVFVNSARVTIPDILVANGVVHVIDGVLNPNNTAVTPGASSTSAAFPGASPTSSGSASGVTTKASAAAAAKAWQTGAVGLGALFGGAGMLMNL